MEERHLDELARLEKLCFADPWTRPGLAAELDKKGAVFRVAELGGKTAGYAGMNCVLDECYVDDIAVFPEFRRNGIAQALLESLICAAKERGASFLTLEVRESNAPAIALYEKLGFQKVGRRRGFYVRPDEDAILYTLFFRSQTKTDE